MFSLRRKDLPLLFPESCVVSPSRLCALSAHWVAWPGERWKEVEEGVRGYKTISFSFHLSSYFQISADVERGWYIGRVQEHQNDCRWLLIDWSTNHLTSEITRIIICISVSHNLRFWFSRTQPLQMYIHTCVRALSLTKPTVDESRRVKLGVGAPATAEGHTV